MIQQMDQIYANAFVTIIAAAGRCAHDGLPGVGGPPRHQGRITIGETHLIEVSTVGSDTIKLSDWATRGWTYQEGFLSRRRLVFTENEVLFLCNKKLAKETQMGHKVDPYKLMPVVLKDKVSYQVSSDDILDHETRIKQSFSWMIPPAKLSIYLGLRKNLEIHTEEYSKRTLSRDCDSLNAFLGILKYYELNAVDENGPVSHLWGIPLKLRAHPEEGKVYFNLLWNRQTTSRRRKDLPSWSWSGWSGAFQYMRLGIGQLEIEPDPKDEHDENKDADSGDRIAERVVQIRIPSGDSTVGLHRFIRERRLDTPRDADPKELFIASFVVPLRFRKVATYPTNSAEQWSDPSSWGAHSPVILPTFAIKPGVFLGFPMNFDRDYEPESHIWGLVLPNTGRFDKDWNIYHIIILHPLGNEKYERAGIVSLFYIASKGILQKATKKGWWIYLDDQDHAIKPEREMEKGQPNVCPFLKDSEWQTVCLV